MPNPNGLCRDVRLRTLLRRSAFLVTLIGATLAAAMVASPIQANWPATIPGSVDALGIDDTGNIYTTSWNSITKILPDGLLAGGNWPLRVSDTAVLSDLVVDGAGNIYAIDSHNATVSKILPGGTLAGGRWPVHLTTSSVPMAIAIDHEGNLYVASAVDNTNVGTVSKILPDGLQATGNWPITLTADSAPYDSTSIAIDTTGNIFLISYTLGKVWKILPNGALAGGAWPVACGSYSVATDGAGNIYCTENGAIAKILPNGTRAGGEWPASVFGGETVVLTLDAAVNVYTTGWNALSVWKILTSGVVASDTWPKTASNTSDMLIDATGNLFVANGANTVAKMIGITAPAPPATPGAPSAVSGDRSATVTIAPTRVSARYGAASSYTVRSDQDSAKQCTITAPAVECVIDGLTNGAAYTFRATANLLAWRTATSVPSKSITPSTAVRRPVNIRWSGPFTTRQAFTATFRAAPATTYTINATPKQPAATRTHGKKIRGKCRPIPTSKNRQRTVVCRLRIKRSGRWLVSITPFKRGIIGTSATHVVKITETSKQLSSQRKFLDSFTRQERAHLVNRANHGDVRQTAP